MRIRPAGPTTSRTAVLTCLAIALFCVQSGAQVRELIRYTFEDLAENPESGAEVVNTAPLASTLPDENGRFVGSVERHTGGVAFVDGNLYELGTSISLLSDGDYINTENHLSDIPISGLHDYTAMAWINVADTDGDHFLFGSPTGSRLHLGTRDNHYFSGHWADDLTYQSSPTPMPESDPGFWHHVTFQGRASDGMQRFYLDGDLAGEGARGGDSDPEDGDLLIGAIGSDRRDRNFIGHIDEVRVFSGLLSEAEIRAAMVDGLAVALPLEITSLGFTSSTELVIDISDLQGGVGTIDVGSIKLSLDDGTGEVEVPVEVSNIGPVTRVAHSFVDEPPSYLDYDVKVEGRATPGAGGAAFQLTTSVRSLDMPTVVRPGQQPAPVGGWDLQEFAQADWGEGSPELIRDGYEAMRDVFEILGNPATSVSARATVPAINHADPDWPGKPAPGIFAPDAPFLTDQPFADDDNFVIYARTTVEVPDDEDLRYTFRITGDDGYALRITGATFTSISGTVGNRIDPQNPSTAIFPDTTGDTNAFIQCEFPEAGQYLVEFVAFELASAAFQEVCWAKGTFDEVSDTTAWQLVGDHDSLVDGFVGTRNIPESLIPAIRPTGNARAHFWFMRYAVDRGRTDLDDLDDAAHFLDDVAVYDATFDTQQTVVLPTFNHSEDSVPAGAVNPTAELPIAPGVQLADRIVMLSSFLVRVEEAGDYTFQVRADDGFLLRPLTPGLRWSSVSGEGQIDISGYQDLVFPDGTSDSNTFGSIYLPAGDHRFVFLWYDETGNAHFEITTAKGVLTEGGPEFALLNQPGGLQLVGDPLAEVPDFEIISIYRDVGKQWIWLRVETIPGEIYAIDASTGLAGWTEMLEIHGSPAMTSTPASIDFEELTTAFGPEAARRVNVRARWKP